MADAEPELADTVTALAETSNAGDWQRFNTMVCPRTQDAIGTLIRQSSPRYDTRFGPEVRTATTVNRVTGITQSGPNSGRFLAHEAFAVPPRYRQYYKDVDYTGTMIKDDTGTWKLCDISADFVE